jgi:bacillithiol biosynthesis cysteine-adding enzyme BshC
MQSVEKLDYRELPSYKSLFLDYLFRFERLAPFFPADPQKVESWRGAAERVEACPRPSGPAAAVLRDLNRSLGADQSAMESIDALEKGALAIVTGQQVGLFGGPLYALYKALTAVALAQFASSTLDRPVVALFWMDTDDHDFDELRHVHLIDGEHRLVKLSYEPSKGVDGIPAARRRLESRVDDMISKADESLGPSEFKQEILDVLRDSYRAGRSLPDAFGSLLLRMTRGTGLAVVDPASPDLKSLAVPLFEREVLELSESSRLVQATTSELLDLGYHAQATSTEGRLNLFHASPERFHIVTEDSGFRVTAGGSLLTKKDLTSLLRSEPERFSPNVLLRSLYQETLLPTLAYVAGPNELAYLAQIGQLYRHFGLPMPLIAPRASFTVVERPHARFMERYGVKLTELRANDELLLNRILLEQASPNLEKDLSDASGCVQKATERLERDLAVVDPTLVPTVRSTRGKLLHHLKELEAKGLRALKRKSDTLSRQFFSARTALFPDFEMQERRVCPLQYLAKYGWHFADMVRQSVDTGPPTHTLLYP